MCVLCVLSRPRPFTWTPREDDKKMFQELIEEFKQARDAEVERSLNELEKPQRQPRRKKPNRRGL